MVTHKDRGNEVMCLKSGKHPCVTLALIAAMPKVFEAVQDKCITKANCKKDSKSFYVSFLGVKEGGTLDLTFFMIQIKYNFDCLRCPNFFNQIVVEKLGNAVAISKPVPLPAMNVSCELFSLKFLGICCSLDFESMREFFRLKSMRLIPFDG